MGNRARRNRVKFLKAAVGFATSSLVMTLAAQNAIAQRAAPDAETEMSVSLPEGPLARSLLTISKAFRADILAPEALIDGKMASTVNKAFSVEDALDQALLGSTLGYEEADGGYVLIVKAAKAIRSDGRGNAPETETILVTGQQIDRPLQQTKESVALITAETINTRSLFDIEDVLLQTANVVFTEPGSFNVTIRGVSRLSFAVGGVGDSSTTFYDHVAITNQAVAYISQNLWDVQQVEFLRGPQSTNLGRNALIGALVIRSNNPQLDDFAAAGRLEVGNFDTYAFEAMVNVPITSNTAVRITGERSQTDGFIDNVTLRTDNEAKRNFTTLRAKVLTEFSDRFRGIASLQYVDGETGAQFYLAQADGPLDTFEARNNVPTILGFEGFTGSLNLTYDFTDHWAFQSITAFSEGDFDRLSDSDSTERDDGFTTNPTSQFNISQELRASFTGKRLRGVLGGYFLDDSNDTVFTVDGFFNPALAGVPPSLLPFYPETIGVSQVSGGETDTTNFALFTQWEYGLTDALTLSAGLRYDRESFGTLSSGQTTLNPLTPLPDPAAAGALADMQQPGSGAAVEGGVAAVNGAVNQLLAPFSESVETTFDAFLPEFGLTYSFTPDVRASLFYKRGYRAGGAQIEISGALNEFDPEFIDNFELSLRSQWFDQALIVNANAYYGFWKNQQVNVPIDGNQFNTRTENIGRSRIWGLEVELSYEPTEKTQLFGSLGYARTKFQEFCSISSTQQGLPDCALDGVAGKDLSGNDFAVSPDWTASFGGQQYITDHIYAQANITYQGGSFSDVENRPNLRVDGYFLANASAGYDGDWFDVRVYVRNLFDTFYPLRFTAQATPNQIGLGVGTPREYGLILSAQF